MTQNAEKVRTAVRRADESMQPVRATVARRRRQRRWTNLALAVMALMVIGFLVYSLPPYAALNPTAARRPMVAPHYWLIVGHVAFGTIAIVTLVLQFWPWLRNNHRAIHRWSGRLYVFAGVLPTAALALATYKYIPSFGSMGVVMSAVLWVLTSLIGWWRGRQHRYAEHRRWMLYSFAIVWGLVIWGFGIGEVGLHTLNVSQFPRLIEAARWDGWVADLIVVQWWLNRTASRRIELPSGVTEAPGS